MKKKLSAGLAVGMMIFGMTGVASATTQTFNFESSVPQGVPLTNGVQPTEGYSGYGFGNYFLWSSGAAVTQSFTQSSGSTIDLSFNFAAINSWDGNDPSTWWASPDIFNVKLDGNLIFSEYFDNGETYNTTYNASPPITYGTELTTGSDAWDSAYLITLNGLTSTVGTHTLSFYASGAGWQGGQDESFAVDNISVTTAPVPIPGAIWLLGSGLAGLIGARRKKK